MQKLVILVLSSLLLASCTASGKIAGKTNGPLDPQVTFHNACNGAKIADGVFQAAVVASGGKIPASEVQIELDAFALVTAICSGPVPSDLNSTLLAITADAAPIGALVAKYSHPAGG